MFLSNFSSWVGEVSTFLFAIILTLKHQFQKSNLNWILLKNFLYLYKENLIFQLQLFQLRHFQPYEERGRICTQPRWSFKLEALDCCLWAPPQVKMSYFYLKGWKIQISPDLWQFFLFSSSKVIQNDFPWMQDEWKMTCTVWMTFESKNRKSCQKSGKIWIFHPLKWK